METNLAWRYLATLSAVRTYDPLPDYLWQTYLQEVISMRTEVADRVMEQAQALLGRSVGSYWGVAFLGLP